MKWAGKEAVIRMARGSSYFLSTKGTRWDGRSRASTGHSPDDAPLAVVEGPDDSNRIYTPVTKIQREPSAHYKHGEIETLDIIRMSLTAEEFQGFLKGNVLKYQIGRRTRNAGEDYKAKFARVPGTTAAERMIG